MTLSQFISTIDDIAWGPVMLILLVGTGFYLSFRMGFIQFTRIPYWWKNTAGKLFHKHEAGEGEVTPLQALTTALAATVGTGNIAGVTGAIFIGGPGAVFWMWVAALVGMMTKYSEVVLAVRYRERNANGDWVGGPMYYIKNGLGQNWAWLGGIFCVLAALAAFGIGNATQVQSIADAINNAIDSFTPNAAGTFMFLGGPVRVTTFIVGCIVAVIVALVLFGGIKRIGQVTEKLVPFMAVVYIVAALIVIFVNIGQIGKVFGMIFQGAFSPEASIDLHGLNVQQAFETLRGFFKASWYRGMRCVIVVPGRGRNSPDGIGILREKLKLWFTQEPFKRVVLAFCTARPHDGGPGSLYVLLRKYKKKGRVYWDRMPPDEDLF